MKEEIKCPVCLGKGTILRMKRGFQPTEEQKKEIYKMYRNGETLRFIANKMGIPHPQSIAHIIDQLKH